MRRNIVDILSGYRKITNVVILSHNIDFMFLQTVVVSSLRKAGNPRLLVFGDAKCVQESFERQQPFLDGLGVRYRVIPIEMSSGYRFHPKIVLACGEDSAKLIIGSGNLTFGGWGENGEIWSEFSSEDSNSGNLNLVRELVNNLVRGHQAEWHIQDFLEEGFDENRPWVDKLSKNSNLVIRYKSSESLLQMMQKKVALEKYEELHIFSPFYDKEGQAIFEIQKLFEVPKVKVNIPQSKSNVSKNLLNSLILKKEVSSSKFLTGEVDDLKTKFVHAKIYAFINRDYVDLFIGSANCSLAALSSIGHSGNCEAVTWDRVSKSEYEDLILKEIELSDQLPEPVELTDEVNMLEDRIPPPAKILAASFEAGRLIISYQILPEATIEAILVDNERRVCRSQFSPLAIAVNSLPGSVKISFILDGKTMETAPHWVDHEGSLSASYGAITFSSLIKDNIDEKKWGLESYAEIVKAFNDNIKVLHRFSKSITRTTETLKDEINLTFSEDEIFAGKSVFNNLSFKDISRSEDRHFGLGSLILNWFGIGSSNFNYKSSDLVGLSSSDENAVDLEVKPSFKKKKVEVEKIKMKINKQITGISEKFRNKTYFESRSPERFVADIRIASVLLRVGLREDWIKSEDYIKITCEIWSALFFSCQLDEAFGWIDYYLNKAPDKSDSINRMKSVELTVAMSLWAHGFKANNSADYASFRLSSYLSVARHPWIWQGATIETLAMEISKAVVVTDHLNEASFETFKNEFSDQWFSFMQMGVGFAKLEEILNKYSVSELADKVNVKSVNSGDLLWQGKLGFAVCEETQLLTPGCKVKVRTPQTSKSERLILGSLLVPLKNIIYEETLPEWRALDNKWKKVILSVIEEVTSLNI